MKYCKNCGTELADDTKFCTNCGAPQTEPSNPSNPAPTDYSYQSNQNNQYNPYERPAVVDSGSAGWGVLGFCFPIVGLILFLVWKDSKPKTSKVAGIGALVSVIISVVCYILAAVAGMGAAMM